jgi:hypothetical protein
LLNELAIVIELVAVDKLMRWDGWHVLMQFLPYQLYWLSRRLYPLQVVMVLASRNIYGVFTLVKPCCRHVRLLLELELLLWIVLTRARCLDFAFIERLCGHNQFLGLFGDYFVELVSIGTEVIPASGLVGRDSCVSRGLEDKGHI